jgi:serine/threonine-protein kinase RsbW
VSVGASDDCVADIELAVTEACTNALRHAASHAHEYEVQVDIEESICQIRVIHAGDKLYPPREPQPVPVTAESGRGLFLMKAMVDRLDFEREPQAGTIVKLTKRLAFEAAPLEELSLARGASS